MPECPGFAAFESRFMAESRRRPCSRCFETMAPIAFCGHHFRSMKSLQLQFVLPVDALSALHRFGCKRTALADLFSQDSTY